MQDQCLMLSNDIVESFPGKLWCCTGASCKTNSMMKGFTMRDNLVKKHKKPSCKLFLPDVLHDGKKSFGKNMDHSTDPNYLYGRPTLFRTARLKKPAVEEVEVEVEDEVEVEACPICPTTQHRCSDCKKPCCNMCRADGENSDILCKDCKAR